MSELEETIRYVEPSNEQLEEHKPQTKLGDQQQPDNKSNDDEELQRIDDINALFVSYGDDLLNKSIKDAIKRKTRVKYKCFDVFGCNLAFGTSSGAIYLFKLEPVNRSACNLSLIIPCDQGSIEVVRFLPTQTKDLLIVAGTVRGSLLMFKLSHSRNEGKPTSSEVYRAESFTGNNEVKLIEPDIDLLDPHNTFHKLYICDSANRIYVLDNLQSYQQTLRTFFQSTNLPSLVLQVNDSQVNQLSVFRSLILISTNKTTLMFDEQNNSTVQIGNKKRKGEGFYGGCFFSPSYKPARFTKPKSESQSSLSSIMASNENIGDLQIYVARPSFRLWQVSHRNMSVEFTHQFNNMIKMSLIPKVLSLERDPIHEEEEDRIEDIKDILIDAKSPNEGHSPRSSHFEHMIPIYSSTLGNLLLSFTQHDIYVVDPVGARLITWHTQEDPIVHVACNENEVFILSKSTQLTISTGSANPLKKQNLLSDNISGLKLAQLTLMAPTQLVLELHRLNRFMSLMLFVDNYVRLFSDKMAVPITGQHFITTEGGLLRNVLLNAWDIYASRDDDADSYIDTFDCSNTNVHGKFKLNNFKALVREIIIESREMRRGNLTETTFVSKSNMTINNENLQRLRSEPYASLVSLNVSIQDLHSSHVIHFSRESLSCSKKSMADLQIDDDEVHITSEENTRHVISERHVSKKESKIDDITIESNKNDKNDEMVPIELAKLSQCSSYDDAKEILSRLLSYDMEEYVDSCTIPASMYIKIVRSIVLNTKQLPLRNFNYVLNKRAVHK